MENQLQGLIKSSTAERGFAFATATGIAGIVAAVGYFDPTTAGIFPACPFHALTGLACPGCGMTRGLHALMHGDPLGALDYNLILPGILFFFGYLFISLVLTAGRGRGLNFRIFTPIVVWGFFGLALVFTILRNLPYYPFNILAP